MKQKVGIIGRGNVGSALRAGLERAGYEVRSGGKGSAKDTAAWADVIMLALPYAGAEAALSEAGDALRGKTVIDVTNPLNQEFQLAFGFDTSAAEKIQAKARSAKVVKCFNAVFASVMSSGKAKGEQITALAAGDDANAKEAAMEIARDIGFDAVDAGPLRNARWLETLGFLNIQLGYGQNLGTDIGFKLVR